MLLLIAASWLGAVCSREWGWGLDIWVLRCNLMLQYFAHFEVQLLKRFDILLKKYDKFYRVNK